MESGSDRDDEADARRSRGDGAKPGPGETGGAVIRPRLERVRGYDAVETGSLGRDRLLE